MPDVTVERRSAPRYPMALSAEIRLRITHDDEVFTALGRVV
jgi:hypothetical protein